MTARVLIVGGGIAGLAVAYELHRETVPFVLLEERTRPGGVILSEEVDGFVLDAGPDALLVQKPDGVKLCHELGLGDRLVSTRRPRVAYVQRAGRLHPLPAASVLGIPTEWGPFIRTSLFSWTAKLRMGAELVIPARVDESDESIGAFMRRRFGQEAVTYLAEPLLAGIHAGDVDRLSIRALFPRLVEAERAHGSLLRAFRRPSPASTNTSHGEPPSDDGAFRSLPGGLSELTAGLMRALPADSMKLHTRAVRLSHEDGRYRVSTETGPVIDAASVVLATPAFASSRIVRAFDPQLADLCDGIRYASVATVVMAYERSAVTHPLNGSGFVVPRSEGTGILAASWLSSKWPHRAPEGRVLMRTFVGGGRDPEALELSDGDLVARSINALTPLVGISDRPLFTRVYRWDRANAQHEIGHLERVAAIDRALEAHPGLFVTGSAYRGVGIPDCVRDGRATARQASIWLSTVREAG
jgi:protoporphyrinogen/coproporphyrinogen III oxidase